MPLDFDKQSLKGKQFLRELAGELGNRENIPPAARLTRAVFRALRNRLTTEESFQLLSQLPMPLKAVYVDGWIPSKKKKDLLRKTDFVLEVMQLEGSSSWRDFANVEEATLAVISVFKVLKKHVSPGEYNDMITVLPIQLKKLMTKAKERSLTTA